MVSLLFCFCNGEVLRAVKRKLKQVNKCRGAWPASSPAHSSTAGQTSINLHHRDDPQPVMVHKLYSFILYFGVTRYKLIFFNRQCWLLGDRSTMTTDTISNKLFDHIFNLLWGIIIILMFRLIKCTLFQCFTFLRCDYYYLSPWKLCCCYDGIWRVEVVKTLFHKTKIQIAFI
jgi:hypothetical protein